MHFSFGKNKTKGSKCVLYLIFNRTKCKIMFISNALLCINVNAETPTYKNYKR